MELAEFCIMVASLVLGILHLVYFITIRISHRINLIKESKKIKQEASDKEQEANIKLADKEAELKEAEDKLKFDNAVKLALEEVKNLNSKTVR